MVSDFHQQPQQQASKPHRFRTQLPGSTLRLRHDFRMQPDPHIAQDQGNADKQQPQDRVAAPGAETRLMHLPVGRFNAKTPPIGGAKPAQGAMVDAPGGIQQGFAPVTPLVAPRVVTDHGQVKVDSVLWSALQGRGRPAALLDSCQLRSRWAYRVSWAFPRV
jgi:hypothetical protein